MWIWWTFIALLLEEKKYNIFNPIHNSLYNLYISNTNKHAIFISLLDILTTQRLKNKNVYNPIKWFKRSVQNDFIVTKLIKFLLFTTAFYNDDVFQQQTIKRHCFYLRSVDIIAHPRALPQYARWQVLAAIYPTRAAPTSLFDSQTIDELNATVDTRTSLF